VRHKEGKRQNTEVVSIEGGEGGMRVERGYLKMGTETSGRSATPVSETLDSTFMREGRKVKGGSSRDGIAAKGGKKYKRQGKSETAGKRENIRTLDNLERWNAADGLARRKRTFVGKSRFTQRQKRDQSHESS